MDTLYRSEGRIPESFLRGCGLPEEIIVFARSLVDLPIQFYSCFISHSSKDHDFAARLHTDLQNKGIRCWFAPLDIRGVRKIYEQIDKAIRIYDRLLLVLSERSMKSEWVRTEIARARQKEITERRKVLFPISLAPFEAIQQWEYFDSDIGKSSSCEIREYFIPDFGSWNDHDSYARAFERLLRVLKA